MNGNYEIDVKNVKTLEHSPQTMNGNYQVWSNDIKSLVGAPEVVNGNMSIKINAKLKKLDGFPKTVIGDLTVHYGKNVIFTEEQIREVCNISGKVKFYTG